VNAAPSTAPCVIDLCTEGDGDIAVYLTDTTCSSELSYCTSKCGVGYSGTTCNVDYSSIYSWYGSYWEAEGCNNLGNPCGGQGECPSSVANVCQNAISASPSPSASQSSSTASPSSSTSIPPNKTPVIAGAVIGTICGIAVLLGWYHYCIRVHAGGGYGYGSGGPAPVTPSQPEKLSDTCLQCRRNPKNGAYDFCGTICRDSAFSQTPALLEVPPGHVMYEMGKSTIGVVLCEPMRTSYKQLLAHSQTQVYRCLDQCLQHST
jgi:hypothetical protein